MRRLHPADLAHAALAAEAVSYEISLFLGVGRFAHAQAASLDEARREADRLARENPTSRKPMIYAVNATGRSALVTMEGKPMPTIADHVIASLEEAAPEAEKPAKAKKPAAKREKAPKRGKPAKKAAKAKAGKKAKAAAKPKALGKRAQIEADAANGKLPSPPNFEAETHRRFRPLLAEIVAAAKAGDVRALRGFKINPVSSSPKAMLKYRDLCLTALKAKAEA